MRFNDLVSLAGPKNAAMLFKEAASDDELSFLSLEQLVLFLLSLSSQSAVFCWQKLEERIVAIIEAKASSYEDWCLIAKNLSAAPENFLFKKAFSQISLLANNFSELSEAISLAGDRGSEACLIVRLSAAAENFWQRAEVIDLIYHHLHFEFYSLAYGLEDKMAKEAESLAEGMRAFASGYFNKILFKKGVEILEKSFSDFNDWAIFSENVSSWKCLCDAENKKEFLLAKIACLAKLAEDWKRIFSFSGSSQRLLKSACDFFEKRQA